MMYNLQIYDHKKSHHIFVSDASVKAEPIGFNATLFSLSNVQLFKKMSDISATNSLFPTLASEQVKCLDSTITA